MWKFPTSIAFPILTFPSLRHTKAPNVANNDAEDINAKHSNFKTIFCDKTKTLQLVLHYCSYSLSSNLMPIEMLLNSVEHRTP